MLGHELRNPLAPMVLALDIARRRGGEVHEEQRIIERQVVNLVRLVDDLLDVSRITRGKIELAKGPMEIATALDKAIELVKPLVERKSQRLEVSVPARGLRVEGDPFRLAQALSNLLTNATKYTPERGVVRVTARREKAHVVVTTTDDGIGIPAELLPEIFGLFVQGLRRRGSRGWASASRSRSGSSSCTAAR